MAATTTKAIILAAGLGSRLRPHTSGRPKCLVEIDGVSLLDAQLAVLRSRGISDIVIVGGYRAEMLRGKAQKVLINEKYAESNMVWSLFTAADEIESHVLISYGDIVYSGRFLDRLLQSSEDIAVAVDMNWESYWRLRNDDPLQDAESLKIGTRQQIVSIGEVPNSFDDVDGQYMGLLKVTPTGGRWLGEVFQAARSAGVLGSRSLERSHMTDLLQALVAGGYVVMAEPNWEPWVEIDTPGDLQLATVSGRFRDILRGL